MPIEVGQIIPEGTFKYVPYSSELDDPVSVLRIFPDHVLIACFSQFACGLREYGLMVLKTKS